MTIDIRAVREDELPAWFDCVSTGFLDRPNIPGIVTEVLPHWDLSRVWGAFDGDLVVGTARTWATELTVPGCHPVKAAALSGVTVRPTHRRQGILRRMLAAEHAAARARGELAGLLYASDYPIYSRFGYGSAVQTAAWVLDVSSTGFHDAAGGQTGTVAFVPTDEAAVELVRDLYDRWRPMQPGEIWRRPITYLEDLGHGGTAWGDVWKGFLVVHSDASGVRDGYARYHAEAKWDHRQPRSTLTVDDMHALNAEAEVALWRFLANVDLVTTIRAERRHPGDRLPWLLTNGRAAELADAGDGMWVRLHDIPAALAARGYEQTGSIVLEVVGRAGDGSTERVRVAIEAGPDGATAEPTEQSPDLTIDRAALGAAYLGGARLRHAVVAAGCDEHRPGALDEADRLLGTRDAPWSSTFF